MSLPPGADREARRQQWLLRALRGEHGAHSPGAWLAGTADLQQLGLRAYQANAAATAGRALEAAYPTVQQLLGPEAFTALAQAHWHAQPPSCGDLAAWGKGLPGFIAAAPDLAGEPYLADVARLDWALHQAQQAADDDGPVADLPLLGTADAAGLRLRLRAGHAVLQSAHPVHTLWAAHRSNAHDRFAPARQALAARRAEAVRVARQGLAVVVVCIDPATASFEQDLLQGRTLGQALTAASQAFAFEPWLIDSLQRGTLAAVLQPPSPDPSPDRSHQ